MLLAGDLLRFPEYPSITEMSLPPINLISCKTHPFSGLYRTKGHSISEQYDYSKAVLPPFFTGYACALGLKGWPRKTAPKNRFLDHDKFLTSASFFATMKYEEFAEVAELADAVDSKSTALKSVPVRVRPSAPRKSLPLFWGFFYALFWSYYRQTEIPLMLTHQKPGFL